MHRRQYIPGSQIKVSRTQLAEINKKLARKAEDAQINARNEALARKRAEAETLSAKTRRMVSGVRAFFTQPVRMPKFGR
jgi:enoyl-CoA hydratase/carnithine racemase